MYETGVGVAFLIWVFTFVVTIVRINSQMERNLNRIGQRLSWLTMTPKPMSRADYSRSALASIGKFLFIQLFGLLMVITSWLSVALSAGTIIYQYSKDAGAPQSIKEFRWKLKNLDLPFDAIAAELFKLTGFSDDQFEQYKQNLAEEVAATKEA